MRLEGWHIVIIIVLAIVLFGAPKLPGLARSVGQSLRIFKSEVRQMKDENRSSEAADSYPMEGQVVNPPAPQHSADGPADDNPRPPANNPGPPAPPAPGGPSSHTP